MYFSFTNWLRTFSRPQKGAKRHGSRRPQLSTLLRAQLQVENLEERITPATDTWTGLGVPPPHSATPANAWSLSGNWTNGVPVAGDNLVFGNVGVSTFATLDNLGTVQFGSITFNTSGYSITTANGSSLKLTGGISVTLAGATETISVPLTLSGGNQTLSLAGATLIVTADVTSTSLVVSGGTLQLSAATELVSTTGVTVNGGTLNLNGNSQTIASLTLTNGTAESGAGVLTVTGAVTSSGTSSITGKLSLANPSTVTVNGTAADVLTILAIVTSGGITKAGGGELLLSGTNTYNGPTVVSAGTLDITNGSALGTAVGGTAVDTGGTLQIDGTITVVGEILTLDGGTLLNNSGTNVWKGNVAVSANSIINVVGSTQLSITGIINGSGTLTIGTVAADTGTLIYNGPTSNLNTSTTTVEAGTLELNQTTGVAIDGPLTIGTNGAAIGTVLLESSNQIVATATVTVNGGTLNLQSFSNTIAGLGMTGGKVEIEAGALTVNGNITSNTAATPALISSTTGTLNLGGGTRTISVAGGPPDDLTISAIIANGGLTKTGAGELVLSGANTYAGFTTVSTGILDLQNNNALGTGGTVVDKGATLQLDGTINNVTTPANVGVNLNGGTLGSVNGDNTFAGNIGLSASSFISAGSTSTLTLSGIITGTAISGLTVNGAGVVIENGPGNSYTGPTTVSAGSTLDLNTSNLVSTSSLVTVVGTLNVSANNLVKALTVTGGTVATLGAAVLTLGGNVTFNASTSNALISGNLNLGQQHHAHHNGQYRHGGQRDQHHLGRYHRHRHLRPDEGRDRHADPLRHQQLFRRHYRQRRHPGHTERHGPADRHHRGQRGNPAARWRCDHRRGGGTDPAWRHARQRQRQQHLVRRHYPDRQ
jgi:fibronectin-binding autotransporter adhesin